MVVCRFLKAARRSMSTSAESFQVLPSFEGFLKNTTWPVLTFFIVACTLNYSFITSAETRLGDDFKSLRDDVKSLRDDVKSVEKKLDGKMDKLINNYLGSYL